MVHGFGRRPLKNLEMVGTTASVKNTWAGERPLKDQYPRLCHLSANKDDVVKEMGKWVEDRWQWDLVWRMRLFEREMIGADALLASLQHYSIKKGESDTWTWGR